MILTWKSAVAAVLVSCAFVPRPAAAETFPVVTYSISGGFAGVKDTLTVYADGRVTLKRREGPLRQLRLSSAQLAKLEARLDSAPLARSGPPGPTAADGMALSLVVTWHGKTTRVEWSDPTPIPPPIKPLVTSLDELELRLSNDG